MAKAKQGCCCCCCRCQSGRQAGSQASSATSLNCSCSAPSVVADWAYFLKFEATSRHPAPSPPLHGSRRVANAMPALVFIDISARYRVGQQKESAWRAAVNASQREDSGTVGQTDRRTVGQAPNQLNWLSSLNDGLTGCHATMYGIYEQQRARWL